MLGGADNPNGELPSYITGADIITIIDVISQANALEHLAGLTFPATVIGPKY